MFLSNKAITHNEYDIRYTLYKVTATLEPEMTQHNIQDRLQIRK